MLDFLCIFPDKFYAYTSICRYVSINTHMWIKYVDEFVFNGYWRL